MSSRRFAELFEAEFAEPFFGMVVDIEERKDRIAQEIHEAFDQQAIVDLIRSNSYFGTPNEHGDYVVQRVLARALRLKPDPVQDFLSLALDADRRWFVRCDALNLLAERADRSVLLEVLPLVADSELGSEQRQAALRAVSQNGVVEVLDIINHPDFDGDWHNSDLHLTVARAQLGESSAIDDLLTLTVDAWTSRRHSAKTALDELVAHLGGADAVARKFLADQGNEDADDPLLALLERSQDERIKIWAIGEGDWASTEGHAALLECLNSDSWKVRRRASEQLVEIETSAEPLLAVLRSRAAPRRQKLWALRTLLRMDSRPDAALIEAISERTVPWDFEAEPNVRKIVIDRFGWNGQPGTDVRYEIERFLQEPPADFDIEGTKHLLRDALVSEGLDCSDWKEAGDDLGSGNGEYWVLRVDEYRVELNKHGPIAISGTTTESSQGHSTIDRVLINHGIRILAPGELGDVVPGLNIYYFGRREPLTVRQLLFYWQD